MRMIRPVHDALMLGSLTLFCRTAECESFVAAARAEGLTAASVSRAIARLEARLGVRLFERTTRRVRLTEAGRSYYLHCRAALAHLAEADRELSGQQLEPEGSVRLSLPTPLGHRRILPLLPEFAQLYPKLRLHVHLGNRNVDLIGEGFDLAVRGRIPPDSGLVARPLMDEPLVVVAAPAYLHRAGTPNALDELARHQCVQFILPSSGQPVPWQFHHDGKEVSTITDGALSVSDDLLGAITLARHGAGLLQVPRFMVEAELADGRLVLVLDDFAGATRRFSLLYPARQHLPYRVKLVIDFLLDALGQPTVAIGSI